MIDKITHKTKTNKTEHITVEFLKLRKQKE